MRDRDKARDRDMFAAAALTGMLAHSTRFKPPEGEDWHVAIAQEAYGIADAMLAARDEWW